MILKPKILLAVLCAAFAACQRELPATFEGGPVTVGFAVGPSVETKTTASLDGLSSVWTEGDRIALWALDSGGSFVLNAQPFSTYSVTGSTSLFTSTLSSPMQEGQYSYFASYPVPDKISGGKAQFTIPSEQDGNCGNGAELLFSDLATSGPLKPIDWAEGYDHSGMSLEMSPLVHRLRFYMNDVTGLDGETIEELVLSFPKSVAGKAEVDLSAAASGNPTLSAILQGTGENTLHIVLDDPVPVSSLKGSRYINVAIAPTSFSATESMLVSVHTQSKIAAVTIPLKSRTFAAGHSTPVRIIPSQIRDYRRLFFTITSNPLGEDIQSITLTAPSGCNWGSSGSNVLTYSPSELIRQGDSFHSEFLDVTRFESFGGKDIAVTYETEHLTVSQTVHIGSLSGKVSGHIALEVPWLLNENFNSVASFSSNDEYKTSKAGSYSSHSFLNGWAGARIGAEAGKCIRIACRRETSARYDARVDSAPLNAVFKKTANLVVEFDYGANNQYGGIPFVMEGNMGQTCNIGYITTTKNYKSGDTDGNYQHSFYIKEYSGSYSSTPNSDSFILSGVPAGNVVRISWRTVVEANADLTNTTAWLYIDNVKVKISNQ